jgi:hypothetical protein
VKFNSVKHGWRNEIVTFRCVYVQSEISLVQPSHLPNRIKLPEFRTRSSLEESERQEGKWNEKHASTWRWNELERGNSNATAPFLPQCATALFRTRRSLEEIRRVGRGNDDAIPSTRHWIEKRATDLLLIAVIFLLIPIILFRYFIIFFSSS